MWIWDQSQGALFRDGKLVSKGYSGKGRGKNNPALQGVVGVGPIPQGNWKITGKYNSARVGPYALVLEPENNSIALGRSAFRIHGDSVSRPGDASNGCIILPRKVRELIWSSGDFILKVIE